MKYFSVSHSCCHRAMCSWCSSGTINGLPSSSSSPADTAQEHDHDEPHMNLLFQVARRRTLSTNRRLSENPSRTEMPARRRGDVGESREIDRGREYARGWSGGDGLFRSRKPAASRVDGPIRPPGGGTQSYRETSGQLVTRDRADHHPIPTESPQIFPHFSK